MRGWLLPGRAVRRHQREALQERKQAGLHGGMQFTYRNPQRSTEPATPGARCAAALVVGALEFGAETGGDRPDDGSPYARVAAYARADYYTPLRAAWRPSPKRCGPRATGRWCPPTRTASSTGPQPIGPASAGGARTPTSCCPARGSLVVLGAVVTDAPLVSADPEPVADGCGSCRQCLDGCPTGAIVAPGTVDARRCLAWLVQADGVFDPDYRVALGDRIYGCDDCSEVCPPNRVRVRQRAPSQPRSARHRREPPPGAGPRPPQACRCSICWMPRRRRGC